MRIRVDIDRLILDIHAAPLDPDRWNGVLGSLCEIHRAEKGQLLSVPATRNAPFWSISTGVSDEAKADYVAEFAPGDVWALAKHARNENAAGIVSAGEELIDRSAFLQTRFYNEFLAPHGYDRFLNSVLRSPVSPGAPLLSAGSSLAEAAESLQISIHTARTQLKAIQQKTSWHTQSELARMVEQFGVIDPQPREMRPPLGDPGNVER